jgi:hypothetical protein
MEDGKKAYDWLAAQPRHPGCYNEPEFLAIESHDPIGAITGYARYVLERQRTPEYDNRTRAVVTGCANILHSQSGRDEIRGKCGHVTMALLGALEQLGVWCFAVQGSARFRFPKGSKIRDKYFWINDAENSPTMLPGHVWLVAPPYKIVDMTSKFQHWQGREEEYLPIYSLSESAPIRPPEIDLWRPSAQRRLWGQPSAEVKRTWKTVPPSEVVYNQVSIRYQPHAIQLPEESLEKNSLILGGRPVKTFWQEELRELPCLVFKLNTVHLRSFASLPGVPDGLFPKEQARETVNAAVIAAFANVPSEGRLLWRGLSRRLLPPLHVQLGRSRHALAANPRRQRVLPRRLPPLSRAF